MKFVKLLLLTVLLASVPTFAALTESDRAEFAHKNLLKDLNPGAENGFAKWTFSGGTFDRAKSGTNFMGIGNANFTWDASTAGQTLTSASVTIPNGYANTNGLYRCKVMNLSGATTTMSTWDGTTAANAITIDPGTTAKYVEIMAPFGASGTTTAIRFTSVASDEPLISIDDCWIGENYEVANISQAALIGQIKITGCSAAWSTSSTSLAAFSACSGGTYTVLNGSGVSSPSTNIPGIKFSSLSPGNYTLKYEGFAETTGGNEGQLQFWDGTNTANEVSKLGGGSTSTAIGTPGIQQTISYSTAQSNITFSIRGQISTGTASTLLDGTTANPGVISVYYYPTQSQQAVRMDATSANWSGTSTLSGTTTSTSYADPGSVTGAITVSGTPHNVTCTATSSKVGIDCTLPGTGNYKVCFSGSMTNSTTGDTSRVQLTDGSGTVIVGEQAYTPGSGTNLSPMGSCGNYTASSTTVTFKVQGKVAAGTGTFNVTSFSVNQLDYPYPSPYFTHNVTSSTSGQERIERANINLGSSCAVNSQSGSWLSTSGTCATSGSIFNITSGEFSATPSCLAIANDNLAHVCNIFNLSSSSFEIFCFATTTGTNANTVANVICQGPH